MAVTESHTIADTEHATRTGDMFLRPHWSGAASDSRWVAGARELRRPLRRAKRLVGQGLDDFGLNIQIGTVANHLTAKLHGCLKHRTHYQEHTAWAHRTHETRAAA